MNKYTKELKEIIITEYLENKFISYKDLSDKYSINKGTIKVWVKKYRETGEITSSTNGRKKKDSTQTELDELRIENEILKKFQAFLESHQD